MRCAVASVVVLMLGCSSRESTRTVDVAPPERAESWSLFAVERDEDAVALTEALAVLAIEEGEQAASSRASLEARRAAASATTRNALPTAWLIAGGDPTLEYYDDPIGLATTKATRGALDVFPGQAEGALPMPVLIRARRLGGADPLGFRETVAGALGDFPWLSPDDLARGSASWPQVAAAARARGYGSQVLVLEVSEIDRFFREEGDWDLPVTRVDATATLIDASTGGVLGTHTASGFAQDLRHRWGVPGLWALLMVLGALATTGLAWWRERGRALPGDVPSLQIASLVGMAAYVAGLVLAGLASQVSGGLVPDWSQTAVLLQLGVARLPHPAALAWPAVHGGVVMLGPVLLLAWAALKVQAFADVSLLQRVKPERLLAVVAPAAQAGALTVLFASALASEPGLMGDTAAPLATTALLASLALARRVADLMVGSERTIADVGAALLAAVALLVLLPLGLFGAWAWPVSVLVAVPVVGSLLLTRERRESEPDGLPEPSSQVPSLDADGVDALLARPSWVAVRDPEQLARSLREKRALVLSGPSRSGLTRCVAEVLHCAGVGTSVELDAALEGGDVGTTPFASVAALLERLGVSAGALQARVRGAEAQAAVQAGVEQTLRVIPAVEAVLGLLDSDVDVAGVQRSRVIEDGASLVLGALDRRGVEVVVLASVQCLDPSSDELLARVVERSGDAGPVWLVTHSGAEEVASHLMKQLAGRGSADLPQFTPAQAAELVAAAGVRGLEPELIEYLNEASARLPGLLLGHLRQLVDAGLLVPALGGGLEPVRDLEREAIEAHCRDFGQRFLQRIADLPERDREVLQVAALCGRTFTVSEVAVATQRPLVEVARRLHGLASADAPLLDDLRSVPGWLAFRSSYTFEALRDALNGSQEQPSELARAVHLRVALPPPGAPPIPAERRLHHALLAPAEARPAAIEVGRVVLERLADRVAWPELETLLGRLAPSRGHGRWEDEVGIDLVTARLARHRGDAAAAASLRDRLERHIDVGVGEGRAVGVLFPAVVAWGDLLYGDRSAWSRLGRWSSELVHRSPPLVREALAFYLLLIGPEPAPGDLRAVLSTVADLPPSSSRSQLEARFLNKLAEWCWFELHTDATNEERLEHFRTVVEPLLDRSLRLRQQLHDVRGQAMDYSARGRALLYRLGRPAEATQWFEKNLELVESRGIDSDLSVALNFVATARKMEARGLGGERAATLLHQALYCAQRAVEAAERLCQNRALAFAAVNLCEIWLDRGRPSDAEAAVDKAAEVLTSESLWSTVPDQVARDGLVALAERARAIDPPPLWASALSRRSTVLGKPSDAATGLA